MTVVRLVHGSVSGRLRACTGGLRGLMIPWYGGPSVDDRKLAAPNTLYYDNS